MTLDIPVGAMKLASPALPGKPHTITANPLPARPRDIDLKSGLTQAASLMRCAVAMLPISVNVRVKPTITKGRICAASNAKPLGAL